MKLNDTHKFSFIGISIGSDSSNESGIVLIDRDLNLLKTDKAYQLSELKTIIANFGLVAPTKNTILCVDMPKNVMMLTGKWRIESKQTQVLNLSHNQEAKKILWRTRFSDRGADMCKYFVDQGMDVFRYNSYFTINTLHLSPPFKTRLPAGCKFLQSILEEKLGIKGIPSNLLPLPTLLSIVGAFNAWKIGHTEENIGYKQIGVYKNLPIITALNI